MNSVHPRLVRAAIYARFSTDRQREASIEDQIRRCREIAAQAGLVVAEWQTYEDSAISGMAHANEKRDGYKKLIHAWAQNQFDVLLVDEFSRLSRDDVEQARLRQRLRDNRRVRLLTADGIDSYHADWELRLGLTGVLAQDEIRKTQFRVVRGMEGQLARGYMVACPAFGYDLRREFDAIGNQIGTHWTINENEARIVREVFERRASGESMHSIARWLNASGIACSRRAQKADGGYWRPARVRGMLSNSIYRGWFSWHGSTPFKYRARRRGEAVEERQYPRPQLRLVTDELWFRCNGKGISRTGYGGGKHALSGLITCGCCGGTLVVSSGRCRSVYCATCTLAKATKGEKDRQSVSVAVAGVHALLIETLRAFLTTEFVMEFRAALHRRLSGDCRRELAACEAELKHVRRVQSRFSQMLAEVDGDDPELENRYREARRRVKMLSDQFAELSDRWSAVDEAAVAAQMAVDPKEVLGDLFSTDLPVYKLRALLTRIFPVMVFEGKLGRYRSIFRIQFSAGATFALASQTEVIIREGAERRFELRYIGGNHRREGRGWVVTPLRDV